MNDGMPNRSKRSKRDRYASFGDYAFDMDTEELFKSGMPVKLQPLPARLLAILLCHKGELVRKEDIKQQLWPSSIVDYEQRIASIMRDIRSALEEDSQKPEFLETVSKKGYRFIGVLSYADSKNGNIQIQLRVRKPILMFSLVVLGLLGLGMIFSVAS
ncbi:MAG: winged helix-turn-helix domain-containing protein [Pseudomonadota bacterium]